MNYNDFYLKITKPFKKHAVLLKILKILYYTIPIITALTYFYIILTTYISGNLHECIKTILIPFVTFVAVTIFRKIVNSERPYTRDNITPLISRDKGGESFPSRHTASLGIIAMAGLYYNIWLGIILWCMTIIQGIVRIICGVHYPEDIISGIIISLLSGLSFFI